MYKLDKDEMFANEKHSSLFYSAVSDEEKKFIASASGHKVYGIKLSFHFWGSGK